MTTLFAALGLGLIIGGFLGALGGGGAILTVPALVYLLGQDPQDATASSLIIVGAASLTGIISYARGHHVRWRLGLLFGLAGAAAAFAGTAANRLVNQHYLLIGFALVMFAAATGMLIRTRAPHRTGTGSLPRKTKQPTPDPTTTRTSTAVLADTPTNTQRTSNPVATAVKVAVAGLAVGFLTGFFGVGGGFVIVPVLVLLFNLPMTAAAATSLLIIAINSGVSLAARAGQAHFDWAIIIPFTLAAMAASLAGKSVAGRLPEKVLTLTFAGMLIAIGLFVAIQNATHLTG